MGGQIGGGTKSSLHNLSLEVRDYQIRCRHGLVGDAAWLNDDEAIIARDTTNISEGEEYKPAVNQLQVGFQHLFAQNGQQHGVENGATRPKSLASNRLPCPVKVEQWRAFVNGRP